MSNSLEASLHQATVLTFEDLGFIIPTADLEDEQKAAPIETCVEIVFRGLLEGRLILMVSQGLASLLVTNMLGDDMEPDESAQLDAVGELANVVAGNVLPLIAGNEVTFTLEPPVPARLESINEIEADHRTEVHVGLDGGRADVFLFVCGDLPEQAGGMAA